MTTLLERIRRGEQAIADAKAEGQDVAEWEAHLAELKRAMMEYKPAAAGECWNCGATMSSTYDTSGRPCLVCWECAVTV